MPAAAAQAGGVPGRHSTILGSWQGKCLFLCLLTMSGVGIHSGGRVRGAVPKGPSWCAMLSPQLLEHELSVPAATRN